MKIKGITFLLVIIICVLQCGQKKEDVITTTPGNTPPVIKELTLVPLNPTIRSEITAQILCSDKESDPITYKIKWFLNGREIGEGMSFAYEEVQKGDGISAEVTPFDGTDWGESVRTNEITVIGLPPKILSLQIAPESLFVTTPQVVVTALVEDPDKDSVRLIIHWVVRDEVIQDTVNALQLSRFGLKKNDVITGSAFVDDGEYRSDAFFFELHIANAPPVFTTTYDSVKTKPDSIYYKLPITDPDGDTLSFELIDAPTGINIDQENGIIYGNAGELDTFDILIRATDDDGAYLDAKFTLIST